MRSYRPILILVLGLGGALLSGCATSSVKHPVPVISSPSASQDSEFGGDDLMADDFPANAPTGEGNATALAHYAAGISYEWNDDDKLALQQFDQASMADLSNERLIIKVAERFLKSKQPEKAVAILSQSAKRPEATALLLSWLARADLQAGKTTQALAASRLSIQKAPNGFDGYESELEILFQTHQLNEAARTLNHAAKAIQPDPAEMIALGGLYVIYLKAAPKDMATRANAIALLDRAGKLKFSSLHLWQTLADTYTQVDQPQKAAAIYLKLLSEPPELASTREALHEKLASIYFQSEDKTNAMKQLEAIVRDNPTRYPRAWFYLGELAFENDKLPEAAEDYGNAIHWDPGLDEAFYKLALVQLAMHQTSDAFRTLGDARARFPKTFNCEFYTGVIYMQIKNYDQAVRHLTEAEVIAMASDRHLLDYRFYFQIGEAFERAQQFKQADDYLQKCIALNPEFGEALNYLGYMLAERGEQLPRARTLIENAVRLEPKNGAYLDSLAWVLFKQRDPQQALPWALKAMEFSPEPDATVLDHLGEIYMALHQAAKAIDAWKKSLSIESNPDVKKKLDIYSGGA